MDQSTLGLGALPHFLVLCFLAHGSSALCTSCLLVFGWGHVTHSVQRAVSESGMVTSRLVQLLRDSQPHAGGHLLRVTPVSKLTLVNLQWTPHGGDTCTFVVTSQEHFGDFCSCRIAASSLTDGKDPMKKGNTANQIHFLEIYKARQHNERDEKS